MTDIRKGGGFFQGIYSQTFPANPTIPVAFYVLLSFIHLIHKADMKVSKNITILFSLH